MHYQAMILSYSPTSGVFGDGRKPRVNNKLTVCYLYYLLHPENRKDLM